MTLPPPPCFPTPLRIALVGAPATGKSALLSHILTAWPLHTLPLPPASPPLPSPPQPQRPRSPLFPRVSTPRLSLLISRVANVATALLRHVRPQGRCDVVPFEGGIAYDASGPIGTALVRERCGSMPDVVVVVCRLDGGRVNRADRLSLAEIVACWGETVLERTVCVLSRGWATPVGGLQYAQFVRGRMDLLWRFVMDVVPPAEVGVETEEVGQEGEEEEVGQEGEEEEEGARGQQDNAGIPRWEWVHTQKEREDELDDGAFETYEEDNSDNISVSAVKDDAIKVLYDAMGCAKDRKVYADPQRPPMLVAEMAEACPKNESGEKILPDGRVWLAEVLQTILQVATKAREQQVQEPCEESQQKGFWGTFGDMLKSLSQDGLRILVAEIVIVALCMNVGSAIKKRRERMLKEVENEDVLLEISDEEFEKLNKTTGRIIFAYKDPPEKGKEKRKTTKEEREQEAKANKEALRRAIDEEMERRKNEGSPPNPSIEQLEKDFGKL